MRAKVDSIANNRAHSSRCVIAADGGKRDQAVSINQLDGGSDAADYSPAAITELRVEKGTNGKINSVHEVYDARRNS